MSSKNKEELKIAYVHPRSYPSQEVNALQAIQMAAAFSEISDTEFFVPRVNGSLQELKKRYGVIESSLKIHSICFNYVPDRILMHIPDYFEKAVSANLQMRPKWRKPSNQKVLFVRDSKELAFWAKQRRNNPFYRDWIFIFEAHSTIGLRPNEVGKEPVFIAETDSEKRYQAEVFSGLSAFDIVICVTQALTTALTRWSKGEIKPFLIRHASPLPRLSQSPKILFNEKITIGYIGQISQYKGVNVLLESLQYLPKNCSVRLVGRFPTGESIHSEWLDEYKRDPGLNERIEFREPVPIEQVAEEIDACDILVQPASGDILNTNFEAPLKSYDYMVRGKPIVAADVPCHRELYADGINAILYDSTAEDLALKIKTLADDSLLASAIASGAWEQSVDYHYLSRAKKILSLVNNSRQRIRVD